MYTIVGLGNPGSEYEGTRHNVGFTVVDAICEKLGVAIKPGKGEYVQALVSFGGGRVLLIKPMTYMNNSGVAVRQIMEKFDFRMQELLIVYDDFHLPLGTVRIRIKGTDGGHNGMASIIYQLESNEIARIRCGIGGETLPQDKLKMSSYVLSPFEKSERGQVRSLIERARDAALVAISEGIPTAMNRFNSATA